MKERDATDLQVAISLEEALVETGIVDLDLTHEVRQLVRELSGERQLDGIGPVGVQVTERVGHLLQVRTRDLLVVFNHHIAHGLDSA